MGSTSPIRSAIEVSGVASFSEKRESRWTQWRGVASPSLLDQVAGRTGDRVVGIVPDLGSGHLRDPFVEQRGQGPDDPGLGLAPLAQEDDVVAGQEGVLQLGQDGVLEAEDPLHQGQAGGDPAGRVAPDLLVDGKGFPS